MEGLQQSALSRAFRNYCRVRWDFVLVFLLVAVGAYLATSLQGLILDQRACLLGLGSELL
jgi:hypothetical protein